MQFVTIGSRLGASSDADAALAFYIAFFSILRLCDLAGPGDGVATCLSIVGFVVAVLYPGECWLMVVDEIRKATAWNQIRK